VHQGLQNLKPPLNPSSGSGERCKLLNGVWVTEIKFGAALKSDVWWQQFNDYFENQLNNFHANKGKLAPNSFT